MILTPPPPPRIPRPSITPAKLAAWGPVLTGVAAIVAALATVASGLGKTDLTPVMRRIDELEARLKLRDEKHEALRERVGEIESHDKELRANARACESRVDSLEKTCQ